MFSLILVKIKQLISLRDILTGFMWQRQKLGFWLVGTNNCYQNEMPTKIQSAAATVFVCYFQQTYKYMYTCIYSLDMLGFYVPRLRVFLGHSAFWRTIITFGTYFHHMDSIENQSVRGDIYKYIHSHSLV